MRHLLTLLILGGLTLPVFAQDAPPVDEIVKKANHMAYYQGKDGRARVTMTITDKQGRTRTKEFTILRLNADEADQEQKFYVFFHEPADERGTVFMVHKHVGKDDDRWLYLPALDLVKQIAASDERTSFVGSDFFYEDVSGRGVEEDEHVLEKTTNSAYALKNTPKDTDAVEFDSYTMYVDKTFFIPFDIRFEKDGQVYRTAKVLKVADVKGPDGTVYKTVTKSQMTDVASGTSTVLEYSKVEYDVGLTDEVFTERFLRKAPREFLD
ncbi:MAG: outer membrane lipoprotein-sorting protein [bacterium]|nr:outer membrane lipoprotein-sorting protein [bacterium]